MAKINKFNGVYLNKSNGKYYYATKIKDIDGNFKSVKSKSIYESQIQCYADLLRVKDGMVNAIESTTKKTNTISKPKEIHVLFDQVVNEFLIAYESKNKRSTYLITKSITETQFNMFKNQPINFLCQLNTIVSFKNDLANQQVGIPFRNRVVGLYRQICEYAYLCGYISQQEYGLVKLNLTPFKTISEVTPSKRKKREKFFYTLEEFNHYIKYVDNEEIYVLLHLLFYGGFRVGEALALRVSDINFEKRYIKVTKTLTNEKKETPPKTSNSIRDVYLPKQVCDLLKDYTKDKLIDERIFNMPYVCINDRLKKYSSKNNFPHLNPHGYRHSCCSFFFQKYKEHNIAIDFKQVADHLGDKVDTILNVYYHVYGSEKTKIIDLL